MNHDEIVGSIALLLMQHKNGYHLSEYDVQRAAEANEYISKVITEHTTTKVKPKSPVVNDDGINVGGTHLQGQIETSYANLVEKLGDPLTGDWEKTDAEWNLRFADGTIATIYNYKDGINYNGSDGMPVEEITDWHVGGYNKKAFFLVREYING